MTPEKYHELRQKLSYRFNKANKRIQMSLSFKQDKEIRITLCFPAEDWHKILKEREIFEDLVEDFLSSDGWYLKPRYKLTYVEAHYCDHDTITRFTMKRIID